MEDVVGLVVRSGGEEAGFLTWGRVVDPVDEDWLKRAVIRECSQCDIGAVESVEVAASLRKLAVFPYFYEGLLHFAWQPIPFGAGYAAWRSEKLKKIEEGSEDIFFYLGKVDAVTKIPCDVFIEE